MNIDEFFRSFDRDESFRYQEYWEKITPRNHADRFKRWVFALCSIRSTWQQNVKSYQALTRDLSWVFDRSYLDEILARQAMGLSKVRSRALWELAHEFWSDPGRYEKTPILTWAELRDEYTDRLFGIGITKTSFAIELMYPVEAEAVCLDVHMLRGFGVDSSHIGPTEYAFWERVWLDKCERAGVASPIARHMYWDKLHGQPNTRYWSHVFEGGG